MNDVGAWMTPGCLQQYNDLLEGAQELGKEKGTGKSKDKKGKSKGSAGTPAKGVEKGRAEKPAGQLHGPKQQAHQLRKHNFKKVLRDFAANKAFFMSFARHPCLFSADGIQHIQVSCHK